VGLVVLGVTGTLELFDPIDAAVVATITWTETTATQKTATFGCPLAPRVYELRVKKSGGGAGDSATFSAVNLIAG
jgi:hypothetical protein